MPCMSREIRLTFRKIQGHFRVSAGIACLVPTALMHHVSPPSTSKITGKSCSVFDHTV